MIKKLSVAAIAVMSLNCTANAENMYVKLGAGKADANATAYDGSKMSISSEYTLNAALGTNIRDFSVELEYLYGKSKFPGDANFVASKAKVKNIGLNAYYNFDISLPIKPFIGLGVGRYKFVEKYADGLSSDSYTGTSFQGVLGGAYSISKNIDLSLEYRHMKFKDLGEGSSKLNLNTLLVGIKYNF